MVTNFLGHALDWFMKLCIVPPGDAHKTLDEIWLAMIGDLKKPKSEWQCIIEIKEIK